MTVKNFKDSFNIELLVFFIDKHFGVKKSIHKQMIITNSTLKEIHKTPNDKPTYSASVITGIKLASQNFLCFEFNVTNQC